MEKFILSVKEATEKAASQTRPQSQFEANLNMMEDVRTLVSRTDSLSYKFDALTYDLNLIKSDIIRQQRTTQGYFEKVDRIEKRMDLIHLGPAIALGKSVAGLNNTSGGNFMTGASRVVEDTNYNRFHQQDILSKDGSSSTHDPMPTTSPAPLLHYQQKPVQTKEQRNYFMDDEMDKEFGKDNFGANLSIIDKGHDQSELLDEDLFMSNTMGKAPPISVSDFGRKSDAMGRYMHSIQEVPEENDKSRTKVESDLRSGPPIPHVIKTPAQGTGPVSGNRFVSDFKPGVVGMNATASPIVSSISPVTSNLPKTASNVSPMPSNMAGQGDQGSQGFAPKRTISDNSLLNMSLNSSIRIQKERLKQMDQSIAEGKHLDESSVIELNIDDNGFLIDAQGFPVLNDKGEPMKLTDDNLDFLKENGLYEEAVIEDCGN